MVAKHAARLVTRLAVPGLPTFCAIWPVPIVNAALITRPVDRTAAALETVGAAELIAVPPIFTKLTIRIASGPVFPCGALGAESSRRLTRGLPVTIIFTEESAASPVHASRTRFATTGTNSARFAG